MSLTIINSDQTFLIQNWIQQHLPKVYVKFDGFHVGLIKERLYCLNLFNNSESIVIYDNNVVNNQTNLKKYDELLKMMIANKNNFYLVTNSLSSKFNYSQCQIITFDALTPTTKLQYIKQICQKYHLNINQNALVLLNTKLPLDYGIIDHEIQKLKYFDKEIDSNIINQYISDYSNETTYNLLENLLLSKTKELLEIYQNLINQKKDTFFIINSLMLQAVNAYAIKKCLLAKKDPKIIANNLGINNFIINKFINILYNLNINKLKAIIHSLAMLDVKIKRNNLNKELMLKLWLINESKKYGK